MEWRKEMGKYEKLRKQLDIFFKQMGFSIPSFTVNETGNEAIFLINSKKGMRSCNTFFTNNGEFVFYLIDNNKNRIPYIEGISFFMYKDQFLQPKVIFIHKYPETQLFFLADGKIILQNKYSKNEFRIELDTFQFKSEIPEFQKWIEKKRSAH